MKILIVHNYYQFRSGEETYLVSLIDLLKKDGHEVYLYTKDSRNIFGVKEKVKIVLNLLFGYSTKRELENILRTFKPNIVHFNNVYPLIGQDAYEICSKYSIPIVQTIHNYRPMCIKGHLFRKNKICELCVKSSSLNGILHKCFQNSYFASLIFSFHLFIHNNLYRTYDKIGAFIFPSLFTKKYFLDHLNIPKSKTYFLPYYVNKIPFEKKTQIDKDKYFLFFGRLSEEKGIKQIIKIFEELPKIKLIIVGDGPLKEYVIDKVKQNTNITYAGKKDREDLIKIIQGSLAVIINSIWYEVLPFTILETIACNKNLLIKKNSNFTQFIRNKNCFFSSQKELKKAILSIAKHGTNKYKEPYNQKITQSYHKKILLELYSYLLSKNT